MIKIDVGGKVVGLAWQHPSKEMPIVRSRERKLWEAKMAAIKQAVFEAVRKKDFDQAAVMVTQLPMKRVRFTLCELFEVTPPAKAGDREKLRCLASATTLCSLKDNFSKEQGRKTSLARAMREAGFSQKERTLINLAYLSRPRDKGLKAAEQNIAAGETIH